MGKTPDKKLDHIIKYHPWTGECPTWPVCSVEKSVTAAKRVVICDSCKRDISLEPYLAFPDGEVVCKKCISKEGGVKHL